MNTADIERLKAHVAELEQQLQATKAVLKRAEASQLSSQDARTTTVTTLPLSSSLHNLLLLSDSALPLGSFAYSSGLESYLAHHKGSSNVSSSTSTTLFNQFLKLSVQSMAHTQIPYVLACFRDPLALMDLDNDLDASTPCTVQRRASVAQGRALLNVWERAFKLTAQRSSVNTEDDGREAAAALSTFSADLKASAISDVPLPVNGHLAPLWGCVALNLGMNLEEAGYIFLLNHAKAVISAAVRASVMGPYQAQSTLAGEALQRLVKESLERVWFLQPEDAGQAVPTLDLWQGRHELLYSRIFNS
ncbi:hypothetical protein LTS08_000620 [Lithohypha guttulata]|uniref:uncharacterized protein n=1 Tax=Lithohypha guttulata TaxID=1690604 RepID=UPI002DDFC9EC|nr:hypothetical protein LTR51_006981 [Lithohypha guttulata]KAK5106501.1 hypothetical protein LTS08_000620 [Lithohypha guttulata]